MGSELISVVGFKGDSAVGMTVAIAFGSALVGSLLLTPVMRWVAPRIGLVDRPDGRRKLHGKAIPLGGGAAVLFATGIGLGVSFLVSHLWKGGGTARAAELVALLMASVVVVVLGLVDDCARLSGRQKLVGQFLAVSILVCNGLVIERVAIFGYQIELGLLAIPLTYFWLFGAINSLNLMDGIDGLATMLGVILVATFAVLAAMIGRLEVAIVAATFAGALCGFLRFNFPPASIFLGDAGSMLIGLVVGTLAIQGSLKGPGTVLLAVPLAVWTLPILDSAAAVLRRKLTGRSIYSTDRGHLHHCLMERLGSNRKVLACVGACCVLTSCAALISVTLKADVVGLLVGLAVAAVLAISGLFGRVESEMLLRRLSGLGRSLIYGTKSREIEPGEEILRLQGSRQWRTLWETLTESATRLHVYRIHLDLNLPKYHEGFSATWESADRPNSEMHWSVDIPLMVDGGLAGRLTVLGCRNGEPVAREIESLLEVASSLERELPIFLEAATVTQPQNPRPDFGPSTLAAESDSFSRSVQSGQGTIV